MRYYNTVLKIVLLTNIYVKCVFSECITPAPDSQVGECKLLTECKTIPLLKNVNRTVEQREILKKIGCGFQGLNPKVCCPLSEKLKKCEVSNGVKGECRDARNCPALRSLTLVEAFTLITPSCNGTDGTSVSICCPSSIPVQSSPSTQPTVPTPPVVQPTPTTSISTAKVVRSETCEATSLPPQPNSGCCGKYVSSSRILGGSETEIDQYPWLVLLEHRDIDAGFIDTTCGGSLISGRYVLTAAHCVYRLVPESVRVGEHDTRSYIDCVIDDEDKRTCNNGSESVPIQKIIINPLYRPVPPYGSDIALLRLNRTVNFSDFIRPICLPSASGTVPSNLYVAGWGATTESGYPSPVKMHVTVPYVDLRICNLSYPRMKLWYSQICAGGEIGKDSCKGDSGGPLMHFTGSHYEVLGIVSFGNRYCQSGHPAVHTKVSEYLYWIRINMHE